MPSEYDCLLDEARREALLEQPRFREVFRGFDPLAREHEVASRYFSQLRIERPMKLAIFGKIADHPRIGRTEARLDRSPVTVLPGFALDRLAHRREPARGGKRIRMEDGDPV